MKDASIISENHPKIVVLIHQFLDPLLLWFSAYIYEQVLRRIPNHPLVQLKTLLDFAPMEAACANYHQVGTGREATHTVPRLLRCLLIRYFEGLSLRETERHLHTDMVAKWFAGYALFEPAPDHATLSRFENYLMATHPRLFFDSVLSQVLDAYPNQRQQSQLGDTFAVYANAALESLIKRLRHCGQHLLQACHQTAPTRYAELYARLDTEQLFGSQTEKAEYALSCQERAARLTAAVQSLYAWIAALDTPTATPEVVNWLNWCRKLLTDELSLKVNEAGEVIGVTMLPKDKRGNYRMCGATDPEATIRNHGPDKQDFGYNVSVATTPDFIMEIQADTGSRPDAAAIPELLLAQKEHHDLTPDKFIYDQAAGTGKTLVAVSEATEGQTQLVVQPVDYSQRSERFSPCDFTLSADQESLTCPHEVTTRYKYRSGSGDGFNFRFRERDCLGCPLLETCRGKSETPTTPRNVFISDYYLAVQRALAYTHTASFKVEMKLRPQVERIISQLVCHNGARRALFRGKEKVDFQMKMQATMFNLKRWLTRRRYARDGRPPRQCHRFKAPIPVSG